MMKAVWLWFFVSSLAFAESSKIGLEYSFANPYEVVVPALNGDPSGADRQVGQVYLDVSSGAGDAGTLRAVGKDGSLLAISSSGDLPIVSSGAIERIERATFTNTGSCAVSSQSGSWITGASDPGTGQCTFSITGWSSAPTCVCSVDLDYSYVCNITARSVSSITTQVNIGSTGDASDKGFNIICMGPR